MIWLVIGVGLWAYSHLMKRVTPDLRAGLGDGTGKAVVSALSFLALAAMIYGYRHAESAQLWMPPDFLRHINNLFMLGAVVLLTLGFSRGVLRTKIRHPMLTAVVVWAAAHLMVNGDMASVVLFGGMGVWALVDMTLINRMEPAWVAPQAGPVLNDVIYLVVALAVFGVIVYIHGWLGYPPLG